MPKAAAPIRTGAASPLPKHHPAKLLQAEAKASTPKAPKAEPVPQSSPSRMSAHASSFKAGSLDVMKGGVKGGGKALPMLILGTFLIVFIAKLRGGKAIDAAKALFGGLILWFMLTMLAQWNARLATLFAGLVFTGVMLELGPVALGGLFTGQTKNLPVKNIFTDPASAKYLTEVPEGFEAPTPGQDMANGWKWDAKKKGWVNPDDSTGTVYTYKK